LKHVKKILFPLDFAEHYDSLLPWVSTFVEKFGATLYVVFVTQDLSGYSAFYVPHGNIQSFQAEAQAAAEKRMAELVKEHLQSFPQVETRVLQGSAAEKILELAQQEGIDLIIMGAHGRKGLERALFGSVADKVVTGARCPVLTIHP